MPHVQVAELRGFSLGVMLEIAKDAGAALKPHLIEFMMVLLEALSGMENPALDYISNRMDATTRSQDVLDVILCIADGTTRNALPRTVPKCLD